MTAQFQEITRVYESLLREDQGAKVLVVGDLMLDRHLWGEVTRISPEAPVPVVRFSRETFTPGGAGNVAMNLKRLGVKVILCGVVGEDPAAEILREILAREGIRDFSLTLPHRPTITKTRIIGGHQQMLRLDREEVHPFSSNEEEALLQKILQALSEGPNLLLLSDYAKGVLSERVTSFLIARGRELGIPVLVDPKGVSFTKYRGATALSPNRQELMAATHLERPDLELLVKKAQELIRDLELKYLLITRSEEGMSLVLPDAAKHFPAQTLEVYDVSGAGDTVIATLAFALLRGLSLEDAVRLSNIAAGIVVGKVGTVPISRSELLSRIHRLERGGGTAHKIYTLDRLLIELAQWRQEKNRIVFTNGCFDLLHAGHVCYLEQAKELGDRLIVAVNSDASVRRLKGPSRPVIPEADRLRVLAALEAVDAVILFDEDTPLNLILTLRPDLLVKGGDYEENAVVGAREVKSWGGEVRVLPYLPGRSTRGIITTIREGS